MNNRQISDVYDREAPTYDATACRGEKRLIGDFRKQFGALLRGETLEIAIGTGLNLPYYSDQVIGAVGVDLSTGMLEVAANRATELHRTIDLVVMDAQHLAFPDNTFDTVAICFALCTVPDPVAAMREMCRVCKPDGRLVMLEHVRSSNWPVGMLMRLVSPFQERRLGCHLARETVDLARDIGLTIERDDQRLLGVFRLIVARPAVRERPA